MAQPAPALPLAAGRTSAAFVACGMHSRPAGSCAQVSTQVPRSHGGVDTVAMTWATAHAPLGPKSASADS